MSVTSAHIAGKILLEQGYTSIQLDGGKLFDCSNDGFFATWFSAICKQGTVIQGYVWSESYTGLTIQLENHGIRML